MDSMSQHTPPFHTFRLGEFRGVELRIHLTTIIAMLVGVWCCEAVYPEAPGTLFGYGMLTWLVAVIWHEFGHLRGLLRCHAQVQKLTLTPLGISYHLRLRSEPQHCFHFAAAGWAMSCIGFALCMSLLWLTDEQLWNDALAQLPELNLMQGTRSLILLKLLIWWHGLMMLNFFPAFPLDGGYALWSLLWPVFGRTAAAQIVTRSMFFSGLAILILAAFFPDALPIAGGFPNWIIPALVGVTLIYAAQFSWTDTWENEYVLPQHRTETNQLSKQIWSWQMNVSITPQVLPEIKSNPAVQPEPMHEKVTNIRLIPEEEMIPDPVLELDHVLERLAIVGFDELSPLEQEFLQRESQRLRRRKHS